MNRKFTLALSCSLLPFGEDIFRELADSGIKAVEISRGAKDYAVLDYEELRRLADKYGIELWSFHLPFAPFEELDISHPKLAESAIKRMKEYIDKATAVGIHRFVIHPSGEPIDDGDRAVHMECSKKSLYKLAEYAAGKGAILAVEDLPRSCLGRNSLEIEELISVHENLYVCFDTNHLLGEDVGDFISRVGHKIVTTHFSDYDFINERHWLPGEGGLDWIKIIEGLESAGYESVILYELGLDAPWSIERDRRLTYGDFKRNFEELTEKKPLTVLGKPKANLGMWDIIK